MDSEVQQKKLHIVKEIKCVMVLIVLVWNQVWTSLFQIFHLLLNLKFKELMLIIWKEMMMIYKRP